MLGAHLVSQVLPRAPLLFCSGFAVRLRLGRACVTCARRMVGRRSARIAAGTSVDYRETGADRRDEIDAKKPVQVARGKENGDATARQRQKRKMKGDPAEDTPGEVGKEAEKSVESKVRGRRGSQRKTEIDKSDSEQSPPEEEAEAVVASGKQETIAKRRKNGKVTTKSEVTEPTTAVEKRRRNKRTGTLDIVAGQTSVSVSEEKSAAKDQVQDKARARRGSKQTVKAAGESENGGKEDVKSEDAEEHGSSHKSKKNIQKRKKSIAGTVDGVSAEWLAELEERRSTFPRRYIGAHVSAAGGPASAIVRAAEMGATAFAFFPRPHRTWQSKPLQDAEAEAFSKLMEKCKYSPDQVVPHGSYLINCGSADPVLREKSLAGILDEVSRCQKLGVKFYNIHPGAATGDLTVEKSLKLVAEAINYVHARTENVVILVENMCGQGNTVGGKFEQLRDIIDGIDDKSRVGVCFDTCHAFASGMDISTVDGYKEVMANFDRVVGLSYLRAVHLNDSKTALGSKRDLHEKIGKGHIGLDAFKHLLNDDRIKHLPIILETPAEDRDDRRSEHADEMELIFSTILQKS
mmetsp:Transcript_1965/g.5881  ORF Transcript_1965/g.5881 Transcript_1965/m.5881 type:complete len:577 (-) Transcript_1965:371-2101(-)